MKAAVQRFLWVALLFFFICTKSAEFFWHCKLLCFVSVILISARHPPPNPVHKKGANTWSLASLKPNRLIPAVAAKELLKYPRYRENGSQIVLVWAYPLTIQLNLMYKEVLHLKNSSGDHEFCESTYVLFRAKWSQIFLRLLKNLSLTRSQNSKNKGWFPHNR